MTFNVLAWHIYTEPISTAIQAEDPDVVLLQELTFKMAAALETDLGAEYPYRVLAPADNPNGIGVFSKFPLRDTGEDFGSGWIGGPLLLRLDWQGQEVALVNFHMRPTTSIGSLTAVERTFRTREEQARLLTDYAQATGLPTILGGDGNHTPLSTAHAIFTANLTDAWLARGFGLGHTFPDSTLPGSDRPHWGDVYVPPWLARIDYVYVTPHWEVVAAHTAAISGISDHRGVVAVLRLR
jgi:endonuclease/exonuclease/phosphatase (EEP) superfamily protein YafD